MGDEINTLRQQTNQNTKDITDTLRAVNNLVVVQENTDKNVNRIMEKLDKMSEAMMEFAQLEKKHFKSKRRLSTT